jgi:hypothetical protein
MNSMAEQNAERALNEVRLAVITFLEQQCDEYGVGYLTLHETRRWGDLQMVNRFKAVYNCAKYIMYELATLDLPRERAIYKDIGALGVVYTAALDKYYFGDNR